jgi:hypothetical protein
MKNYASRFASWRPILLLVLLGLVLGGLVLSFYPPSRLLRSEWIDTLLWIVLIGLVAERLQEVLSVAADLRQEEGQSTTEDMATALAGSNLGSVTKRTVSPPPELESVPADPNLTLLRDYENAVTALEEIERAWQKDTRRQASEATVQDRSQIAELSRLVERLIPALESSGESALSLLNLRNLAERLRGAAFGDEAEGEPCLRLPALLPMDAWLAQNAGGPDGYRRYLAQARTTAADEAQRQSVPPPRPELDWLSSAESLLQVLGTRRPAPGEPDSCGLRGLHEDLLRILGFEEISVAVGDPIDREIHSIETTRQTAELRPNLVLKVVAPGYRDRDRKVWSKTVVIMSEQLLG